MEAEEALALQYGQKVAVSWNNGKTHKIATVVKVEDQGTWGRGMRPANATPDTRLAIVRVWIDNRLGTRDFGNSLVTSLYCGYHGYEVDVVKYSRTKDYISVDKSCGCKDVSSP